MDMENVTFKPMTKGLGFDKKVENKAPQFVSNNVTGEVSQEIDSKLDKELGSLFSESSALSDVLEPNLGKSKSISDMINSLPPKYDFIEPEVEAREDSSPKKQMNLEKSPLIFKPVGRADYQLPVAKDMGEPVLPTDFPLKKDTVVEPPKVDLSLGDSMLGAFPKMELHKKKFFHQKVVPQPQFTEVLGSFTSSVLDFFVVAGIGTLFIVGLVYLTGIDLFQALRNAKTFSKTLIDLSVLFFGVYLLYFMITRSLFGSSLGDWAFDLQLGRDEDRIERVYPLKVLVRMVVIGLTGFILLPMISYFAKKDYAKKISGLNLFIKNY